VKLLPCKALRVLETVTCSPDRSTLEVLSNYRDALSAIKENSVAGRDHRTKAHFAVGDALVSFGDLLELVGFSHYLDFSRCGDLKRFVQVFAIVSAGYQGCGYGA